MHPRVGAACRVCGEIKSAQFDVCLCDIQNNLGRFQAPVVKAASPASSNSMTAPEVLHVECSTSTGAKLDSIERERQRRAIKMAGSEHVLAALQRDVTRVFSFSSKRP